MPRYERETRVDAPLDEVWAFHSNVAGLRALTPGWLCLRVESATGPDGESDPAVLEAGSTVRLSVRPFDVGPRHYWTARIRERERRPGAARFRDEMIEGPFDRWVHTHAFFADGESTLVRDRVVYDPPLGPLGDVAVPFTTLGLEGAFRARHEKTAAVLEESGE